LLRYQEIKRRLQDISRTDMLSASAVGRGDCFGRFVRELQPVNIIEIGTYNGISTAVLASIAEHVYTFDIASRDADLILRMFGLRHKVSIIVAPQYEIDFQLSCIANRHRSYYKKQFNFDLAFIDGAHDYESVKHDFEIVKFTGRVLFHNIDWKPVRKFVIGELGAKKLDSRLIGYWEDNNKSQDEMISYRLITEDDIEDLRIWKNVNKDGFFYKRNITKKAQKKWYKEYIERNTRGQDFMFIACYGDVKAGCIGYRIINGRIDIYNFMLGNKELEGKKILSTVAKTLWRNLKDKYNLDITVKVLKTNNNTINWYLKNNWSIIENYKDHHVFKWSGK